MNGSNKRPIGPRRGSAYLLVLSVALLVATMGLGALLAVRAQFRTANLLADEAEARRYAVSAIELARLWISQDPQWRSHRSQGVWAANQPIGSGTYTIEASDPLDGDLANRPHDPLVLKATGVKGQARQMLRVTLAAAPEPLEALKFAAHVGGQLHVTAGHKLTAASAWFSTSGSLKNEGTIVGSVEFASVERWGWLFGGFRLKLRPKPLPDAGVPEMYARLGTPINPPSTIQGVVLAPGVNPWGATLNAEGVYVIRTSGNVTLRDCRVLGTLVVVCPGKTVTIGGNVLFQPYRADYPSLIIDGDAVLQYSSDTPLSESTLGTNFNPAGAPFEGVSDADTADTYPSELRGLVHVTGKVTLQNTARVRGLLLVGSTATSDALRCDGANEIVYDAKLYTSPPQGYTTTVKMLVQPGTWRQLAD